MVTAYNGALVIADVLLLLLKIFYYVIEAVYRFFVPVDEKSVAGEIVLVSIFCARIWKKPKQTRELLIMYVK